MSLSNDDEGTVFGVVFRSPLPILSYAVLLCAEKSYFSEFYLIKEKKKVFDSGKFELRGFVRIIVCL